MYAILTKSLSAFTLCAHGAQQRGRPWPYNCASRAVASALYETGLDPTPLGGEAGPLTCRRWPLQSEFQSRPGRHRCCPALLLVVSPHVAHVEPRKRNRAQIIDKTTEVHPCPHISLDEGGGKHGRWCPGTTASATKHASAPLPVPHRPLAGVPSINSYYHGGTKIEGPRAGASQGTGVIVVEQLSPAHCWCASSTVIRSIMVTEGSRECTGTNSYPHRPRAGVPAHHSRGPSLLRDEG